MHGELVVNQSGLGVYQTAVLVGECQKFCVWRVDL
jgi:hypothetical protein